MALKDWWEKTFSKDKFDAKKALKTVKRQQEIPQGSEFESLFQELINEKMAQEKRLLSLDEIESVLQRAKLQHAPQRNIEPAEQKEEPLTQEDWSSAAPALIEALKRFEKQVLHVRATLNPFLDDRESGVVRNMKLKTAQDNIYKTIDSLNELSKSRQGRSEELNRIIKKETMRWNECAKQIGMRLNGEINAMEFKDYMNALDKGFQNAKNELRERFSH